VGVIVPPLGKCQGRLFWCSQCLQTGVISGCSQIHCLFLVTGCWPDRCHMVPAEEALLLRKQKQEQMEGRVDLAAGVAQMERGSESQACREVSMRTRNSNHSRRKRQPIRREGPGSQPIKSGLTRGVKPIPNPISALCTLHSHLPFDPFFMKF
jgi:hypothetical protein